MYSSFYLDDSEQQENFCPPAFAPVQKIRAVRQAAKKSHIIKGDCLEHLDRPLHDLSCEAGGIAAPVYWQIHPRHKKTNQDKNLLWAMVCSYIITGTEAAIDATKN